jgi:hypothetical protein
MEEVTVLGVAMTQILVDHEGHGVVEVGLDLGGPVDEVVEALIGTWPIDDVDGLEHLYASSRVAYLHIGSAGLTSQVVQWFAGVALPKITERAQSLEDTRGKIEEMAKATLRRWTS